MCEIINGVHVCAYSSWKSQPSIMQTLCADLHCNDQLLHVVVFGEELNTSCSTHIIQDQSRTAVTIILRETTDTTYPVLQGVYMYM